MQEPKKFIGPSPPAMDFHFTNTRKEQESFESEGRGWAELAESDKEALWGRAEAGGP